MISTARIPYHLREIKSALSIVSHSAHQKSIWF
jgi:hypothetical protein